MNTPTGAQRSNLDREFWRNSAAGAAANPHAWLFIADGLSRAANELRATWQRDMDAFFKETASGHAVEIPPDVSMASMMLLGLCLENLAKGTIIADHPSEAVDPDPLGTKLVPNLKQRHLTQHLLEDAGLSLTPGERRQVDKLRTFLLWAGRYPVATDALHMAYSPGSNPPASWSSDDLPIIDALVARARAKLVERAKISAETASAAQAASRRGERAAIQSQIESLCRKRDEGGIVLYVDDAAPEEAGAAIMCCACNKGFTISAKYRAAVCGCGTFYHYRSVWDASLARFMPVADQYP